MLHRSMRSVAVSVACALFLCLSGPSLSAGGRAAQESDKKASPKAKKGEDAGETPTVEAVPGGDGAKTKKKLTIEEQYVRDNIQQHLSPTSIQFLDDGRVRLAFDFVAKKAEHETIFTPPVSKKPSDTFRWTNRDDEYYSSYTYTGVSDSLGYMRGLRLSNSGMAHLNLWFLDDVEAEVWYVGSATSSPKQVAALVFTNGKMASIGNNHGALCATYTKGMPQKAPRGTYEPIPNYSLVKLKLVVRNGNFEAWREGRKRQSMEYKPKDFASGRVGLIWKEARSFVSRLEVTGRIDAKKMAEEFRKAAK